MKAHNCPDCDHHTTPLSEELRQRGENFTGPMFHGRLPGRTPAEALRPRPADMAPTGMERE